MKFAAILALCVAYSHAMINCNVPNICQQVNCVVGTTEETCDGRFVPNGGWCGCCHNCISQIDEHESCMSQIIIGAPPTAECGEGLYCHSDSVTCRRKTCAMLLEEHQQRPPLLGAEAPLCLDDGTFRPRQCKGSQCVCVEAEGKPIDGYQVNRWEAEDMHCKCARDKHEYQQTGMVGKMFSCNELGNYKKVQCHGSVCFCVDKFGVKDETIESKPIHQSQFLEC